MNWAQTLPLFLLGLIYGGLIGLLSHWVAAGGWQKIDLYDIAKAQRRVMVRYFLHYLIYLVALFLVYRWTPVLLGAGCGMLAASKAFVIYYYRQGKKQKIQQDQD